MTTELATRPGLPGRLREDGYDLPANLPYERWLEIGETLQQMERSVQWWLGDWWNYGERTYGQMSSQASKDHIGDATGYTYQTVRRAGYTAERIGPERRRSNLSFSHHAEVASLPVHEQESLLEAAETAGMTRYELRDAVRERKEQLRGRTGGVPPEVEALAWRPQASDLAEDARLVLEGRLGEMGSRHRVGFEAGFVAALVWAECREAFTRWEGEA